MSGHAPDKMKMSATGNGDQTGRTRTPPYKGVQLSGCPTGDLSTVKGIRLRKTGLTLPRPPQKKRRIGRTRAAWEASPRGREVIIHHVRMEARCLI